MAKRRQHPAGYEDPVQLASQTAFSVSEVEALFKLFKSISALVIDDGLINKDELKAELEELEGAELENQLLEPIPYHQVHVLDNMQLVRPVPQKVSAEKDELAVLQAEMAL